jgi:chlorobactene glucosyltransferase
VALKSSFYLILTQVCILLLELLANRFSIHENIWLYAVIAVQLASSIILAITSRRNFNKTRAVELDSFYAQSDLPSLTVAIPARNETQDLEDCLASLVNSSYEKLEIIVLDDCSQNKHTPQIIKDFAQKGVRFLAGDIPPENWNAKTYAYSQLEKQANGDIILFCGVDTRFEPNSLTLMVHTLKKRKKSMVSFMPVNKRPGSFKLKSYLIQPSRYIWELAIPRRLLNRPPVLSTCWLITSELLKSSGGFEAVSRSVIVESYFAKMAIKTNDGYSFLRSDSYFGLKSLKSPDDQEATAVRTRYPQTRRRPELVSLLSLYEFTIFLLPFALMINGIVSKNLAILLISIVNIIIILSLYLAFLDLAYKRRVSFILLLMPIAAIYDLFLLNYSMYMYEFREVIWKGRNVCLPVMRVPSESSASVASNLE